MPTANFNLPLIDGASPISIVNDMNSLATATDSAMATLATQGDISAVRQIANNANTQSSAAVTTAEGAKASAETANESAVTAQQAAAAAQATATQANNQATSASEKAKQVEAHTFFTSMAEHPSSPWYGKGSIQAWQSNDGQIIQVSGVPRMNTSGTGQYATSSAIKAAAKTTPRGVQGIPIFNSSYIPAKVTTSSATLIFCTSSETVAYSYSSVSAAEVWVDTDGVVYLGMADFVNQKYAYGIITTGLMYLA